MKWTKERKYTGYRKLKFKLYFRKKHTFFIDLKMTCLSYL